MNRRECPLSNGPGYVPRLGFFPVARSGFLRAKWRNARANAVEPGSFLVGERLCNEGRSGDKHVRLYFLLVRFLAVALFFAATQRYLVMFFSQFFTVQQSTPTAQDLLRFWKVVVILTALFLLFRSHQLTFLD